MNIRLACACIYWLGIFIFGVPRCGSTLVERIIVSGKKFIPLGEETGIIGNFVTSKILEKNSLDLGDANDISKARLRLDKQLWYKAKKMYSNFDAIYKAY